MTSSAPAITTTLCFRLSGARRAQGPGVHSTMWCLYSPLHHDLSDYSNSMFVVFCVLTSNVTTNLFEKQISGTLSMPLCARFVVNIYDRTVIEIEM